MTWLKVIIAGLLEIVWVTSLNQAHSLTSWSFTLLMITLSFYLVISATKSLAVGTVYALFVGIGAAGTVIVDMLFFHQPISILKLILILMLIIGILGLKLTTDITEHGGSN
ncbi:QacE family quaternary ammonium compound efflux SMR transporter [Staphylococcus lugdunensis]|uniref:Multidrug resistance protein, SMR family n=1 Tax=Staphylococcus lugdunensis TaxID=28035 RepID=A0A133Q4U3_STALU|nr:MULTISPECIES: SMR family transporter [Staphylococcus]AMG62306.1 multidrug resistance protein SMR [Staphylococcus lugdunensis]ARJ10835.1 QacE family quaternary ammonium compound efflux SMR transporter [Staphylococcus lugdunensis]ARJ13360.1 QacE family quaternary ammonium compound efflux SMR transporter [Staphylococcus lugdunensis]AST60710.1 QacE family quaternary ammonium compound efflux SMR transporter [Staphylococcus lugdunensis]ATG68250.1 QacE family quaternary ammonium compound efflux SM